MFSLWLPRNTICFYILMYFAILVSLFVLIILHRIHSDCLYSRPCHMQTEIFSFLAHLGTLFYCLFVALSFYCLFVALAKAHSTKLNGSPESMSSLVPPWNEAPAYRKMQEGCLCHKHAPSWSGSLAVSLLCLDHPSLAFLHRGGEVFLFSKPV